MFISVHYTDTNRIPKIIILHYANAKHRSDNTSSTMVFVKSITSKANAFVDETYHGL